MRKLIFFLATIPVAMAADPNLFEGRGFQIGKCYSHRAVRRCEKKDNAYGCALEIFPEQRAAFLLPLDSTRDSLISGENTTDYGIFKFKVISTRDPIKIEILSIQRQDLKAFAQAPLEKGLAQVSPCK